MARHCQASSSCIPSRSIRLALLFVAVILGSALSAAAIRPLPGQSDPSPGVPTPPPTFISPSTLALQGSPVNLVMADLKGDGVQDLIVADSSSGRVSVYLGSNNGGFAKATSYPAGTVGACLAAKDVEGDGKVDVIVCQKDGSIGVLRGNGDGSLQTPVIYQALKDSSQLVFADLNGDGKLDLIVAGATSGSVAVLLNDGKGGFLSPVIYSLGKSISSVVVADFDNDGTMDLLSGNADGSITVLLGRGDGSFRSGRSIQAISDPISYMAVGDFNSDGKMDLAITRPDKKLVTILTGHGDGTFGVGASYEIGSGASGVLAEDVNGDNIVDLVTLNRASNTFSVLLGIGDGTFQPAVDYVAGKSPVLMIPAVMNPNGRADLMFLNSDQTVSVVYGNGKGSFSAARAYRVDLNPKSVAVGDLDGDGRSDLVVTNFCGADEKCAEGTISILLAVGDGSYKLNGHYGVGSGPVSTALVDVNGDKKLDIVAANRNDGTVNILFGIGDGTFQSPVQYTTDIHPVALVSGDFNGDGKPDLAVVGDCGAANCSQPGKVAVLLGTGDGSFKTRNEYLVGYSPSAIATGDLNGDGNLDVIVANGCGTNGICKAAGTVSVLLGDGTGAFKVAPDVATTSGPSAVALGKLSSDNLDMVTALRSENKVAVFAGKGDGTFGSPATYPVGTAPSSVTIADFNGDGKLDVAVANFKDSSVSVLYGVGDGTLQPAAQYAVSVGPESLTSIDQNKNGRADLVAANGNSGAQTKGSEITVLSNFATHGSEGSTTTLVSLPNPSKLNEPVVLTATVTGSSGTPTGTITFTDGGNPIPECVNPVDLDVNGQAVCTTSSLTAGSHSLAAAYGGDGTYDISEGDTTQTVGSSDSTTTLVLTPASSKANEEVTLTASVAQKSHPGSVDPTGAVTFTYNSGTAIPECPNAVNLVAGQAVCKTKSLPVGTDSVKAEYSGDGNYNGSFDQQDETVSKGDTQTAVTLSPQSSKINESVTISATVTAITSGPLSPTGKVTFTYNGGTPIPECPAPVDLTNGQADCITKSLPVGSDTVKAAYGGDANFNTSFDQKDETVAKGDVTVAVAFQPQAPKTNEQVTLTANVAALTQGPVSPGGDVTFTYNGKQIPECAGPITLVNGVAECKTKSLPAGSNTVEADYSGDSNFNSNKSSTNLPVAPGDSKTTLTLTPTSSKVNDSVLLTAVVVAVESGPYAPSGKVKFTYDNGTSIPECPGTVDLDSNGHATCTTKSLPAPSDLIKAEHQGDSNFNPSSDQQTETVAPIDTKTKLTSSKNPSDVNDSVVFTATVTPNQTGGLSPTGTVTFTDNGQAIPECSAPVSLDNNGQAKCSTNSLIAGAHSIIAVYNGDKNFNGSQDSLTQTVNKVGSTTALALVPSSSKVNEPVVMTATIKPVNPGGVSLTGKVTFTYNNGTKIPECLNPVDIDSKTGQASCTTKSLPTGTDLVKADYSGDNNFNSSNDQQTETVSKGDSRTALTLAPTTSKVNDPVQLTATVTAATPGGILPTGKVLFTYNNDVAIPDCPIAVDIDSKTGQASCTTRALPAGQDAVKAQYQGDSNFNTSADTQSETVEKNETLTALVLSPTSSKVNDAVLLTATVKASTQGGLSPTGAVTFTYNKLPIPECSNPVDLVNGEAKCTTKSLPAGSDVIEAAYGGDSNFNISSDRQTETVTPIDSITTLDLTPASSNVNDKVTMTATVKPSSNGGLLPTGKILFTYNSGTQIPECAAPVDIDPKTGIASCSTVSLPAGQDVVRASYLGDGNFKISFGEKTEAVSPIASISALTVTPSTSFVNQPVALKVSVTASNPGGLSPTGQVTFTYDGKQIPECPDPITLAAGAASCTTQSLPAGNHSITVAYKGDSNFNASSDSQPATVSKTTTHTSLARSPDQSVVNDPVTLSATVQPDVLGGVKISGTVTFTYNNGQKIPECSSPITLVNGQATCTTTILPAGSDPVTATYAGTSDFVGSDAVQNQPVAKRGTTVSLSSNPNPVVWKAPITFRAQVNTDNTVPYTQDGGTVTFSDITNPNSVTVCTATVQSGSAACTSDPSYSYTNTGARTIQATYSGNSNFASSDNSGIEGVQSYTATGTPAPSTLVTVVQGYNNTGNPFTSQDTPMQLTITPNSVVPIQPQFSDNLSLVCSVTQGGKAVSKPTCTLGSTSLKGGQGTTSVTITGDSSTPIGTYQVTISVTDSVQPPVPWQLYTVSVVNSSSSISVLAGSTTNNTAQATFAGPNTVTVTSFDCVSVAVTGAPGSAKAPSELGIKCSFAPSSVALAGPSTASLPVTVTVQTTAQVTARLMTPPRIFAAFSFGLPAVILIGPFMTGASRRRLLRVLGLILAILCLLNVVACGGGFQPPASNGSGGTPSGSYQILVQGHGSDGQTYSAVVPLNVAHQ